PGSTDFSLDPLFCNPNGGDISLFDNSPCLPSNSSCGLVGALGLGCTSVLSIEEGSESSPSVQLRVISGKPISFEIDAKVPENFTLLILDPQGRVISRAMIPGGAGKTTYHWHGKSMEGQVVASGVYFAVLIYQSGKLANRFLLKP
ncbi:MAG: hypothetical protein L0Y56_11730, partial [Nitrospira sp.]|nr:hypothetical protein [Nitrospira sp.]